MEMSIGNTNCLGYLGGKDMEEEKEKLLNEVGFDFLSGLIVALCEGNTTMSVVFRDYDLTEPDNWNNFRDVYYPYGNENEELGITWYYCYPLNEGGEIIFNYRDETSSEVFDLEKIKEGLLLLYMNEPQTFRDLSEGYYDGQTALKLFQYGIYGEIIWG